jgi:hypothetical protein
MTGSGVATMVMRPAQYAFGYCALRRAGDGPD